MTALAVVAAVIAVLALVRPGGGDLGRCSRQPAVQAPSAARPWNALVGPALVASIALAAAWGGARAAVVTTACAMVAACAWLLLSRLAARRRRAAERVDVAWAGEILAGLLRAGHVPSSALTAAAREAPLLQGIADAQRVGADVPAAFVRAADVPGREGLVELASAWAVATTTGASLSDAMGSMAEQLAGRLDAVRTVAAELAAPRATGRVMAVLPAAGLLLGFGFGGDPVGFLLDSPAGWACFLAGVGLACAGVLWTEALADRAGGD